MSQARILVIKHGALGDIVLATGPFAAIRRHHEGAEITLLTSAAYGDWLGRSPFFDKVAIDARPPWWRLDGWLAVRRWLVQGNFQRIYDLQTSRRSSRYFAILPRRNRPQWSGIARGCSHPDADPDRDRRHTLDRQCGQLAAAGIAEVPPPDVSWAVADLARFALPAPFALLVPGGAPHRPAKRWPLSHYRRVARAALSQGVTPVVLGGSAEKPLGAALAAELPGLRDLTGATSFDELASLARAARWALGNDTGPMHLIAAAGCRAIVLFSSESDPDLTAPRGTGVTVLRRPVLAALDPDSVLGALGAV